LVLTIYLTDVEGRSFVCGAACSTFLYGVLFRFLLLALETVVVGLLLY